jgi:cell division septal protein FtsQ
VSVDHTARERLVKRALLAACVLGFVAVAVYWFALRDSSTTTAEAQPTRVVAQIGEGKRVILVGGDGRLLGSRSGKSTKQLPVLSAKEPPTGKRVKGHVREEVLILAAAPKPLRAYLAAADYGRTGVDVETTSGIEIRFGDSREAEKKWRAAAAVLADPSVTKLSYVDVHAPTRPAINGEEHELPPAA